MHAEQAVEKKAVAKVEDKEERNDRIKMDRYSRAQGGMDDDGPKARRVRERKAGTGGRWVVLGAGTGICCAEGGGAGRRALGVVSAAPPRALVLLV